MVTVVARDWFEGKSGLGGRQAIATASLISSRYQLNKGCDRPLKTRAMVHCGSDGRLKWGGN